MRGLPAVSTSLSTTCWGAGRSGLPMPRSMMSAPSRPRRRLDAVDLLEDVGRQALDAVEVGHRATNPCGGGGAPASAAVLASPGGDGQPAVEAGTAEAVKGARHGRGGRRRRRAEPTGRRGPAALAVRVLSISASAALTSSALLASVRRRAPCRPGCSRAFAVARRPRNQAPASAGRRRRSPQGYREPDWRRPSKRRGRKQLRRDRADGSRQKIVSSWTPVQDVGTPPGSFSFAQDHDAF